MLITEFVEVKIRKDNIDYYKSKGYFGELKAVIKIKVRDLQSKSDKKVTYECDCCKKKIEVRYEDFLKKEKRAYSELGVFCNNCSKKIKSEWEKKNTPEKRKERYFNIQKKKEQTLIQRYNVDNPMKSKNIRNNYKNNFIKKYNTDNPMKVKEFREKLSRNMENNNNFKVYYSVNGKEYYKFNNVPCSKAQKHINELYNGELNYLINYQYFVDILLKNNIYCEYNGSGHSLSVTFGKISQKKFNDKEYKRYYVLKQLGYKQFLITKEKTNKKIADEVWLFLKKVALSYFKVCSEENWINFDIDNNLIKTRIFSISYNYNSPMTYDDFKNQLINNI